MPVFGTLVSKRVAGPSKRTVFVSFPSSYRVYAVSKEIVSWRFVSGFRLPQRKTTHTLSLCMLPLKEQVVFLPFYNIGMLLYYIVGPFACRCVVNMYLCYS